jgi:hypothetical protein
MTQAVEIDDQGLFIGIKVEPEVANGTCGQASAFGGQSSQRARISSATGRRGPTLTMT